MASGLGGQGERGGGGKKAVIRQSENAHDLQVSDKNGRDGGW